MTDQYSLRRGQREDLPAIAQLLVTIWQQAYANFLPADFLHNMDPVRQQDRHRRYFEAGTTYWVVEDPSGKICGFTSYGPNRIEQVRVGLELYTLYVALEHQRLGLGKQLLDRVLTEAATIASSIAVSVMAANPYLGFYRKNDFETINEEMLDFGTFQEHTLILRKMI